MSCPHGGASEAACMLCFWGCPADWTPETCEHPSVAGNGGRWTCDACGKDGC